MDKIDISPERVAMLKQTLEVIVGGSEWDKTAFRAFLAREIIERDVELYFDRLFQLCETRRGRESTRSDSFAIGDTRLNSAPLYYRGILGAIRNTISALYRLGYGPVAQVIIDSDKRRQETK